jgi:thymidylate kinase
MLIVLEGCDGSGKSTLARNLSIALDAEVIHFSKETENNYQTFMSTIIRGTQKNIIADRFMYGQFVYQTEQERIAKGWLTLNELRHLEWALAYTGARVIHVTAPSEVISDRLKERNEVIIKALSIEQVKEGFREVLRGSVVKPIELDTYRTDWRQVLL